MGRPNTDDDADVIVVGAGPGGSSAAYLANTAERARWRVRFPANCAATA
jgi:ribulose 1,5-bisphosphate synthetase/thiazole synthase